MTVLSAQVSIGSDEVNFHAAPYSPSFSAGIIRTRVDLVEVPVVVRDSNGVAVPDLLRDDFEVFDAGKKQEITAFSVEKFPRTVAAVSDGRDAAAVPDSENPQHFIALVLDDLNSDKASLQQVKGAAERFVSEALAPGDLVGVFTTASSQNVQFTADVQKLRSAIEEVAPHPRYTDELHACPAIRAYEAYLITKGLDTELLKAKAGEMARCKHIPDMASAARATEALAQAIWENAQANTGNTLRAIASVVATIGKMPGQRMVLLTSSGFVSGGEEQWLQELAIAALHSGVVINAMDLRGLEPLVAGGDSSTPTPKQTGRLQIAETGVQARAEDAKADGLALLASGTGGQFFHNSNDLAAGLRRLGGVPEVLYVLGFAAGGVIQDGKYHPLKVRLTRGHHGSVQARMGYNAPAKQAPAEREAERGRDAVLTGSESPSDVAARITADTGNSDSGPKISITAWIDVSRLNFETKQNRREQRLTVIGALFDNAGNFVTGRQAEAELALKDASFSALAAAGFNVALSLHAPSGSYRLKVLVQEGLTGKMTVVSRPIEMR